MRSLTSNAALMQVSYRRSKSGQSRQQSPRAVFAQDKDPVVSCGPFAKPC